MASVPRVSNGLGPVSAGYHPKGPSASPRAAPAHPLPQQSGVASTQPGPHGVARPTRRGGTRAASLADKLMEPGAIDALVARGRKCASRPPRKGAEGAALMAVVDAVRAWAASDLHVDMSFAEFIVAAQGVGGYKPLKSKVAELREMEFRGVLGTEDDPGNDPDSESEPALSSTVELNLSNDRNPHHGGARATTRRIIDDDDEEDDRDGENVTMDDVLELAALEREDRDVETMSADPSIVASETEMDHAPPGEYTRASGVNDSIDKTPDRGRSGPGSDGKHKPLDEIILERIERNKAIAIQRQQERQREALARRADSETPGSSEADAT